MAVSGTSQRAAMLAVAMALVLSGCQLRAVPRSDPPGESPAADRTEGPAEPAEPDEPMEPRSPRSVTLSFAGDVHFEGAAGDLLARPGADLGPMSFALRNADVTVVNLESALTTGGSRAAKELEDPTQRYWFRSPPSALGLLERSGVDAVSIANNHGADYGADGLRDTLAADRTSRLAVLGVGADPAAAYRPFQTTVNGVGVAVLAADASPLESRAPIWDVRPGGGPGLATARNPARLVDAVRAASASNEIVAVYLHWGEEGRGCPTDDQRRLARSLTGAGADIIVGTHAHVPLGAGTLGDAYVSYGLGNFLWYNGRQSDTGVLRLQWVDGKVVRDEWIPGEIGEDGGQPRLLGGSARTSAIREWQALRGCTDLGPGPLQRAASRPRTPSQAGLPAYTARIEALPEAVRRRMTGSSHDPARCPVGLEDLRLLTMGFVGFNGRAYTGQMIVHAQHARGITQVFGELYRAKFPIRSMRPVDVYGGDDNRSMAANNSSGYNCRTVAGQSNFSDHAYGAAVDLNPVENPYVTAAGVLPPAGQRFVEIDRSSGAEVAPGVIVADDVVVRAFAKIGWKWGGVWNEADYQHFHAP